MTDPAKLEHALKEALASKVLAISKTADKRDHNNPFAQWQDISRMVAEVAQQFPVRVIGISGSQGSGKSTLADILSSVLQHEHLAATASSLDDYYLTLAERETLAAQVHPLLRTRGVPGTHDCEWLAKVLTSVHRKASQVSLPRFDKGIDDRVEPRSVATELLILEGWCLGVTPQLEADLSPPCNPLEEKYDERGVWRSWVNNQIETNYLPLWAYVDLWIHLRVPSFAQVIQWRTQQEQQLPVERRMNATELTRFVQHYERLTRWMWQSPAVGPGVVVSLDQGHNVSNITVVNP